MRAPSWLSRSLALLLFAAPACSCEDPNPPPDDFDGNVLVGDARPRRDADELDLGVIDAAADDAAQADATDLDSGAADALEDARAPDATVDCNVAPVATLTASSAAARALQLDGAIVDIIATATVGPSTCRGADAGACQATCTASVSLERRVVLASSECAPEVVGCRGSDCTLACSPPVLGATETFRGRLRARAGDAPLLELFGVLP